MQKVFDNRNAFALKHYKDQLSFDSEGTQDFIMWSYHLWQILNVKCPGKDRRYRDSFFQAVTQNCDSLKFLKDSIEWLQQWQKLNQKPREGVLTK